MITVGLSHNEDNCDVNLNENVDSVDTENVHDNYAGNEDVAIDNKVMNFEIISLNNNECY